MTIKLAIGISDFKKLIEGNHYFIDKSLFIKDAMDDGAEVVLITRPRRFGKTINMSMLYYYVTNEPEEQESKLFNNLAISQYEELNDKYYHQYPTIFLSLKEIKKTTFVATLAKMHEVISVLYKKHRFLLNSDKLYPDDKAKIQKIIDETASETEIESSLANLIRYLHAHYNKKVIVLLDEYDTPVHAAYSNNYYDNFIEFFKSFLGEALKGNDALHRAVVTGITRIAQASVFSDLNSFESYGILRKEYGQYFGFTIDEIKIILAQYNNNIDLKEIKDWYNGYNIGGNTMYNPWSILNCFKQGGALAPYWLHTSENLIVKALINKAKPAIKKGLIQLMQGETVRLPIKENLVFQDLKKSEDAIWALLLYLGYLTVKSQEREQHLLMAYVTIPNREVMFIYNEVITEWFTNVTDIEKYNELIQALVNDRLDVFEMELANYISTTGSYFDFNVHTSEQVFQSLILGLVYGLRDSYIIQSNREAGDGRFDVALIPKDKHKTPLEIMLELKKIEDPRKLDKTAKAAIKQIQSKKYTTVFIEHDVSRALCVGLVFCGKQVKVAHRYILV